MKKWLLPILFCVPFFTWGQHDGLGLSFLNQAIAYNPAITGNQEVLSANLNFRNDWLGDEKHPRTLSLATHTPLKKQNWAIGTMIYNDRIGLVSQNSWYGFGSYKVATGMGQLSFGVKTGVNSTSFNPKNEEYLLNDANDPIFEQAARNIYTASLGLGIYLQANTYYIGMSIPELNRRSDENSATMSNTMYWQKNILAGYRFYLNEKLELTLNSSIKKLGKGRALYELVPVLKINRTLETGILIRSTSAYGILCNYQISTRIKLGYTFDMFSRKITNRNAGNHELMLNFRLIEIVSTENPRFF
jgi:type IX secretion system PorP/SprF family membrane protein